jgi:hypothetical protein
MGVSILWILVAIVVALLFLGLTYVLLFHTGDSNMPLAGRGAGLLLLAGELKVAAVLGLTFAPHLASPWIDRGLIALVVVSLCTVLVGLGGRREPGPRPMR